jgi:PKD repeat protein
MTRKLLWFTILIFTILNAHASNIPVAKIGIISMGQCNGVVNFADSSTGNPTSWLWKLGDGDTSILQNPSHMYNISGVFTVKLIVTNAFGTDSITKQISIIRSPVNASYNPASSLNSSLGILRVKFNTINQSSNDASEGNKDFSCTQQTTVMGGSTYQLSVKTKTTNEFVHVWFDHNANGEFEIVEYIYVNRFDTIHQAIISIPNYYYNGLIRLRVMTSKTNDISGLSYGTIPNIDGQFEDYAVVAISNNNVLGPTVAKFSLPKTRINVNTPFYLIDSSSNMPWLRSSSVTRVGDIFYQPKYTYSYAAHLQHIIDKLGTYESQLWTYNYLSNASATASFKVDNHLNYRNMCEDITDSSFYNPPINQNQIDKKDSGYIFDNGGPYGTYHNSDCSILLNHPCADTIELKLLEFNTNTNIDFLRVYDGSDTTAPLLLNHSGVNLPGVIKAISGKMLLKFKVNSLNNNKEGFTAKWKVKRKPSSKPTANFYFVQNSVPFQDSIRCVDISSSNVVEWRWDFGDGNFSEEKNPKHVYAQSGIYNVTLISKACMQSDTINKQITVQGKPFITKLANQVINLGCNDTLTTKIKIVNSGQGTFTWAYHYTYDLSQVRLKDSSGIINAGDTADIDIILSSKGMLGGSYYREIYISTNNPDKPIDTIKINLFVSMAPCINFGINKNNDCSGTYTFVDTSLNTILNIGIPNTTWYWDLGDSTIFDINNFVHRYKNPGTYQVKLVIDNGFGKDSLTKTLVVPNTDGAPLFENCYAPNYTNLSPQHGIKRVQIAQIDRKSQSSAVGHEDFTCSDIFEMNPQSYYHVKITTYSPNEDIYFLQYQLERGDTIHEMFYQPPFVQSPTKPLVYNIPDRIRIISTTDPNINLTDCYNLSILNGQSEDYTIVLKAPSAKPKADFSTKMKSIVAGVKISYYDLSTNSPDSTIWIVNGPNANYRLRDKLANIVFPDTGSYQLTLITKNLFGSDTVTKTIRVKPTTLNICYNYSNYYDAFEGDIISSNSGVLYDDGGPKGKYGSLLNYKCFNRVVPLCADTIKIKIDSLHLASGDTLAIYAGKDNTFPILYKSGLNMPTSFKCLSGEFSVGFYGANIYTNTIYNGFKITWSTVNKLQTLPIANFSFSRDSILFGEYVNLIDNSSSNTNFWFWNLYNKSYNYFIGKENVGHQFNHNFRASGNVSVSLIAKNCAGSDTITKSIYVLPKPKLYIPNNLLTKTFNCSNYLLPGSINIPIYNKGLGPMIVYVQGSSIINLTNFNTSNLYGSNIYDTIMPNDSIVLSINYNNGASGRYYLPITINDHELDSVIFAFSFFNDCKPNVDVCLWPANSINNCGNAYFFYNCNNTPNQNIQKTVWYFGDGDTAVGNYVTHYYKSSGTYTTYIKAYNAYGISIDSLTFLINIASQFMPKPALCNAISNNSAINYSQIAKIKLNNDSIYTMGASLTDLTCQPPFVLMAGSQNIMKLYSSSVSSKQKCWIDFNDDGIFTPNEDLNYNPIPEEGTAQTNYLANYLGFISIPDSGVVLNKGLRMRIISDINPFSGPCSIISGAMCDLTVIVRDTNLFPLANFYLQNNTIYEGTSLQLTDLSINKPQNWTWKINNGGLVNGNQRNQNITFNQMGTYLVSLKVSNNFGIDSITKEIEVVDAYNICNSVSSTASSGYLFDSGGPSNNYSNKQNCTFLINPQCSDSLFLFVKTSKLSLDTLQIFDGVATPNLMIASISGFPQTYSTYISSGVASVKFKSDNDTINQGFELFWTSKEKSKTNIAIGGSMQTNTNLNFSFNSPDSILYVNWIFGDGSFSSLMNPNHTYLVPGNYIITLQTISNKGCIVTVKDTVSILLSSLSKPLYSSDLSVLVYPNPFDNELSIKSNNKDQLDKIIISDVLGKIVYVSVKEDFNIDQGIIKINPILSNGVYVLTAKSGIKTTSFKLFKH